MKILQEQNECLFWPPKQGPLIDKVAQELIYIFMPASSSAASENKQPHFEIQFINPDRLS